MAMWNGMPGWFGNKGTKDPLDELHARAVQRLMDSPAEQKRRYEEMQAEVNKAEYVRQMKAQYQAQMAQMNQYTDNTGLYNGLQQGISGLTAVSTDPNWGLNQWGVSTITTTGTAAGHNPGYYTIPNYLPGTVYTSTGQYGVLSSPVTPAVTPQNPQIGDKLIMEWDGKDWITRYEAVNGADRTIRPQKKVDFTLDEIEEAAELVNKLARKQVEHEAA